MATVWHIRGEKAGTFEQVSNDEAERIVSGGDAHCIMPLARFYNYAVNGIRFRDWVADLADGSPVESVRCAQRNHQRQQLETPVSPYKDSKLPCQPTQAPEST